MDSTISSETFIPHQEMLDTFLTHPLASHLTTVEYLCNFSETDSSACYFKKSRGCLHFSHAFPADSLCSFPFCPVMLLPFCLLTGNKSQIKRYLQFYCSMRILKEQQKSLKNITDIRESPFFIFIR